MRAHEITQLDELRKNPEENSKVSIAQRIMDRFYDLENAGQDTNKLFISFTEIDKLGINPQSYYKTPLGIYAYPAEWVVDEVGMDGAMSELPFAGDYKYANIFVAKSDLLIISTMSNDDLPRYYKQLTDAYFSLSNMTPGSPEWKNDERALKKLIANQETPKHRAGSKFWNVSRALATSLAGDTGSVPVMWNKLFRTIGIAGILDWGYGIIHPEEKTQAVFFSTAAIGNVERMFNKYAAADQGVSKSSGNHVKNMFKLYRNMSDEELLSQVEQYSDAIKYIRNPTVEMQMTHIKNDPSRIGDIKNPAEEVQLYVINKSAGWGRFINNPTEKVQIAMVSSPIPVPHPTHPTSHTPYISNIKNPSEKIQLLAFEADPDSLYWIENPTEKVQLLAIETDPANIRVIKKPTKNVQLRVLEKDPALVLEYPRTFLLSVVTQAKELLAAEKGKK